MKKGIKKIVTYIIALGMIAGTLVGTGSAGVSAAEPPLKISKSSTDYKKMYKDYMSKIFKTPEITSAVFDHGYVITLNLLKINFTEVKYAKSYDVMVSKDDEFKTTKIYKTDKNHLYVSSDKDDFLTSSYHGRKVKVRANYGYGIPGKWSKAESIGCGKLHLKRN